MRRIYFVSNNDKKIKESEARFERFVEESRRRGVEPKFTICIYRQSWTNCWTPTSRKP